MCWARSSIVAMLALGMMIAISRADGDASKTPPAAGTPSAAETTKPDTAEPTVAQLIEQLDASAFAKREDACAKLAAKGKEAVPALEKAATAGSLEVSSRSIRVLGKLLKSSDEATQTAAKEALGRLAESDMPSAARSARKLLEKKEDAKPGMGNIVIPGGGGFGGRIIINGGQIQLGGGAAMKTKTVSNVNGVKEIEVSEGDKRVKIHDDPDNSIKVELTEKKDGKDVTKKYEAKNVDELKKKHPEGYKLYKEYAEDEQGAGGVQLNIQGAPLAVPPLRLQPAIPLQPAQPAVPATPAPAGKAAAAPSGEGGSIDVTGMMIKTLSAQIDGLRKDACQNASPAAKDELKKQIDDLSKKLDALRQQLDKK